MSDRQVVTNMVVKMWPLPATPVPAWADFLRSSAAATKPMMIMPMEAGSAAMNEPSVRSAKNQATR